MKQSKPIFSERQTHPIQSELQSRFDAVERQRIAVQERVLSLSEEQVRWTPDAAVWSIQQIVEHLVLSEETIGCPQETASLPKEALMFRIVPRAVRFRLVLRALRNDVVLPLPASAIEPHGRIPLSELLTRWETARHETRCVLETLRGHELRNFHSVLGRLTALQTLELGEVHTAYHLRQMDTLLNHPDFPRSVNLPS